MSKFYVTCGSQSLILTTDSADQAALALIDAFLGTHIWIYDDRKLSEADRRAHIAFEALLHLGHEVHVSERGFGRTEAGTFGTADLIDTWHRLMVSVSRMMVAAGLDGSRCWPSPVEESPSPRNPK